MQEWMLNIYMGKRKLLSAKILLVWTSFGKFLSLEARKIIYLQACEAKFFNFSEEWDKT